MPRAASQGTFIWPTKGKKSNSVTIYKLNKATWSAKLFVTIDTSNVCLERYLFKMLLLYFVLLLY